MALNAHALVAITDARGVIIEVNDNFCNISQYSREELTGQTHRIINSGYHPKAFFKDLWQTIARNEVWSGDICNRAKDGSLYWVQSTMVPLVGKNGKPERYIAIRADITSKKDAEATTRHIALHDALTGLPNRRLMTKRLKSAISIKEQQPGYGALLLMDLDYFKEVNDMLGHDVGDELLQQTALRLSRSVRDTDTVARFGGDEFVIILDNLGVNIDIATSNAKSIGEGVRMAVTDPYHLGHHQLEVTPSVGVVLFNNENEDSQELLKQADIALYAAKEAGRNQLLFFEPALQIETIKRTLLAQDLRQAIDKKELVLFYQPIVNAQHQIQGVEALLRWLHPQHGLVTPDTFILLAEEQGLIVPIGEWVLETACKQLAIWQQDPKHKALTMAVNISVRQLNQTNFVDMVKQTLARTGACSKQLMLEITESIFQDNVSSAIAKMNALREEGIRFSLDDFGTGYSSLTFLKRLPIDNLKIDKSFVDDILDDSRSLAIALALISLAKDLKIQVIAEGIETPEQMKWLQRNGCDFFQGYLFSKALHPSDLHKVLENTALP
ncbi:putative bifunctional diguanylate cyclase/phosphodiesterase [Oceanisphaera pacifica]|uniref:EAL domain-containing protein n=1 Tax=Oceanisphaera pacifica TaxID=2818389 RepID=A0ABS3NFU8_9GAMM|nr:EAL domain-containing protein [Oceanisphaera pacifica]MBO1519463.1 EAL domain-containing protein [Oceanisphaera pacifica]